MGRASVKKNKNIYFKAREKMGFTREKASEVMGFISPEKIERIENEKTLPLPDEVLEISKAYKEPEICNYYCSHVCPIGHEYVPEIRIKDLSGIVLEMLASLNSIKNKQERLIEITADGIIDNDELSDFVKIQKELEKISITVETLQLWSERMIIEGKIDKNRYKELCNK